MWIFSWPFKHPKPWGCSEQKCFSSAIEGLRYHDGWGHQGPKDVILDVPDAEEGGAVGAGAASPVEAWETESVRGGGVDQAPVRADESRGQILWETPHQVTVEDLRLPDQLWLLHRVKAEGSDVRQWRPGLVSQRPMIERLDLKNTYVALQMPADNNKKLPHSLNGISAEILRC